MRSWLTPTALILTAFITCALPARRADLTAKATRSSGGVTEVRVGLVFDVGGRGDKSFNDASYVGLARARADLGATIEYIEPTDTDDGPSGLRLFAARGFDLVIAVGYVFSRDVDAVARDYPHVRFACIDYAPPEQESVPPNVVGLNFRDDEGAFLVGAVAALSAPSRIVGFVGGMEIPVIKRFEHGYRAGVRQVCPDCRVLVAYAGSTPAAFHDPTRGQALATSQYSQGADVVFHAAGSTGHGVLIAAHNLQRKAIGVDSDQYDEMPDVVLTSMLKRVDVAVFDTIREVANARFPRGPDGIRRLGLSEGGVDYVHRGPHAQYLSAEVIARVETLREQMIHGEFRSKLEP